MMDNWDWEWIHEICLNMLIFSALFFILCIILYIIADYMPEIIRGIDK